MATDNVNIKIQVDSSQAIQSTENYRKRIKELKDEMTALQLAGKSNTEEYAKASQELGVLVDAISDTAQQARIMSDDFYKMRVGIEGLAVGTQVFSGLTQATELFGVESEDAEKILVKLQAAQNLANVAMNISKALNKDTALMTALNSLKQKLLTKDIQDQTKAQIALNVAKKGAIGLAIALTTALAAVAVAYVHAKDSATALNRELEKKANETIADTVVQVRTLKDGWDNLGDSFESRKQYIIDNSDALEQLGLHFKDVNEAEEFFKNNTEAFIEAQKQRAKASAAMEMASELYKKQLQNETDLNAMLSENASTWQKIQLEALGGAETAQKTANAMNNSIQSEIDKLYELKQTAEDTAKTLENSIVGVETPEQKKAREQAESDKQKAIEEYKRKRKESEDEVNNFIKQQQDEQLKRIKDINNETYEGRLKNIELERDEVSKQFDEQINNAEKLFGKESQQVEELKQLKIDALTDIHNKRLEEIQKENDKEKELADKKKEKDEQDRKAQELAELKKQKTIAETKIIGLKEGSAEYLEVYKEQLNAEMELELSNTSLTEEEKEKIKAEYRQKEKEANDAYIQEQTEKELAAAQAKFDDMSSMVSSFSNLVTSLQDAELANAEGDEEKQAEIRRKYARMNFLSQIAGIGIDTAKGIMSVWSTAGELGPIAGPIVGAIQSAMIAATGIAQTIKAKNEMNNALKAESGGLLKGRSHANGGIPVGNTGVEVEGGEFIINRRASSQFSGLLSAINSYSGPSAPSMNTLSMTSGSGSSIDRNLISQIVSETVKGVGAIPVVVTEHAITKAQRNVSVIENQALL